MTAVVRHQLAVSLLPTTYLRTLIAIKKVAPVCAVYDLGTMEGNAPNAHAKLTPPGPPQAFAMCDGEGHAEKKDANAREPWPVYPPRSPCPSIMPFTDLLEL